jgi:hypothetical protein
VMILTTKGRPLTDADFLNDLGMPGSSDGCFSRETLAAFLRIVTDATSPPHSEAGRN